MVSQGLVSEDFRKQVNGFGLTTAHILYRRPDHQWLLQSYVWQAYDLFPKFSELQKFLEFWQEKLEGPLHSVQVAHCKLIKTAELRAINGEFRLQLKSFLIPPPLAGEGQPPKAGGRGCLQRNPTPGASRPDPPLAGEGD